MTSHVGDPLTSSSMNSPPRAAAGAKRSYHSTNTDPTFLSEDPHEQDPLTRNATPPLTSAAASSAFRNVSACNRCRLRKNKCDQNLPQCAACEKANTRCVGYDPITKREIPRSYVYYLETRVSYFESLLVENNISFKPPDAFDPDSTINDGALHSPPEDTKSGSNGGIKIESPKEKHISGQPAAYDKKQDDAEKLNKLVSNIGMVSVQGASDPRYLGSTSGISFARVVFAAVKSSVSTASSEKGGVRPSKPTVHAAATGGSSMRDSFFGLQTKPTVKQAVFPDRQLGEKLVDLYMEHANPQIPILHRPDFMDLFDRAYATDKTRSRTSRELYLLNIVFAIGAGIIWGSSDADSIQQQNHGKRDNSSPLSKKPKLASQQQQPEEYHASAIVHLESFLGSSSAAERPDGFGGGLEELQAVLLLASFALLRPVAPGLWYIIGVAVRLAVDLGLHYEDGSGIELGDGQEAVPATMQDVASRATGPASRPRSLDQQEKGRREWVRDLRRRLWWCTYSLDRLVSTCVGRPFGITDQVITTEFPSLLDDNFITRSGFVAQTNPNEPSYKHVSYHYFRLRLLQSEILQVLQHQQAQQARQDGTNSRNEFMHTKIPSPFLVKFKSFRAWRKDIDKRLWEWKESAPFQQETGVQFSPQFLELNYWQAVIMLYRNSLTVPEPLANELNASSDVSSPSMASVEEGDDEDGVFLKVAEAGQKVLRLYRQLHRVRLVNFTFLATHHLFMAGISFLYAVWHSPVVRSRLTLDDVDFTVLAATSVLGDLMEKCPPAEACKDAFERMSKATVQMCLSTTGFGSQAEQYTSQRPQAQMRQSFTSVSSDNQAFPETMGQYPTQPKQPQLRQTRRPPPKFDMNLRDLFPEDTAQSLTLTSSTLPSYSMNSSAFQASRSLSQPQQSSSQQQQRSLTSPLQNQYTINSQINAGLGLNSASSTMQSPNSTNSPSQTTSPQSLQQPFYFTSAPSNPPNAYSNSSATSTNYLPNSNPSGIDFSTMDLDLGLDFGLDGTVGGSSGVEDFGLGMDFGLTGLGGGAGSNHDWSDGNTGVDLWDGFFFGSGAGGGGGAG